MPFTLRWIPFIAWHFCLAAIVLSLIALLAGANGDSSLESAAIITFNTSLGFAEFNAPNSTLHSTIASLIPAPPPANTSSITQYLGIKDWYSMHYRSICSGFFAPSTSNEVNISCAPHTSGYTFSLQDILRSNLYPSVKLLADEISPRTYCTAPWIALLYIGFICVILELGLLPWTLSGTRRLNSYGLFLN